MHVTSAVSADQEPAGMLWIVFCIQKMLRTEKDESHMQHISTRESLCKYTYLMCDPQMLDER